MVRWRICCCHGCVSSGPLCLCESWIYVRPTWDKGSIGERTSCLRLASRPGLGPLLLLLLGEEAVVVDSALLCSRPGDGRLDEGVSGLAAGMVSSLRARAPSLALLVWAFLSHVGVARGQRHICF